MNDKSIVDPLAEAEASEQLAKSLDILFAKGAVMVPELAVSGRIAIVVTASGVYRVPMVAGLGALKRHLASKSIERGTTELSIPANSRDVLLPPGLHVVMGSTGAGKSSLIKFFDSATDGRLKRINVLEPFDLLEELEDVSSIALDLSEAMAMAGAEALSGQIPMIDSFRALVHTSAGGNAGKSGVNMAIFPDLTRFNNLLALQGITMLAAINPLSEREQYDEFKKNVESSVVGLFEVTRVDFTSQVIAFTHAIRPRRQPMRYTTRFGDSAVVEATAALIETRVGRTVAFNDSLLRALYPA